MTVTGMANLAIKVADLDGLRFALAAYASSAAGGIGVDPRTVD